MYYLNVLQWILLFMHQHWVICSTWHSCDVTLNGTSNKALEFRNQTKGLYYDLLIKYLHNFDQETFGWLLGDCWVTVEWLLSDCWVTVEWLLGDCWVALWSIKRTSEEASSLYMKILSNDECNYFYVWNVLMDECY